VKGASEGQFARQRRSDPTVPEGESHFRRLLEKLPAGAYTCDPEGLITYFNPQAELLWGRAPKLSDPVDRFCGSFKLFSTDGAPIAHDRCWMALALQTHEGYNEREIVIERPDGGRRTALAHANPIRDEGGRVLGAVNVLVDITERKLAEERLREAREAERVRMARDLHDEVLQDLSYALVAARIAQEPLAGTEAGGRLDEAIEALGRAGRGVRRAVYDLHPGSDREERIVDLLGALVELNRQRSPGCHIELSVGEGFPPALAGTTETELVRIVGEALTNARRHSAARRVWVRLGTEDGRPIAEVADDGRGFDPSSSKGGVGLEGMRERASLIGGNFEVRSGPGQGTSVRVGLPKPS
jgi:PAS domain S-box-containing protein